MINTKNAFLLIALLTGTSLLFSGCRSTEEIVEEEPEVTVVVQEPAPPPPPPPPPPVPEPVAIPDLASVYFAFDRDNIDSQTARTLDDHARKLLDLPAAYRVSIDAYTDHVGGDQYNLRLSYRRANSVVQYLTDRGITANRIESRGLGKVPVSACGPGGDPDGPGCRADRRAELKVIEHLYAPRRN